VDIYKKIDEPPDYYVLSAADLFKIGEERAEEIKEKEKTRDKSYAKFSSCDVSLKNLKKHTKGWQLVKNAFQQKDEENSQS
jgi:hypothetical protein